MDFEERMRKKLEARAGSKSTRSDGRNLLGYDSPVNSSAADLFGLSGDRGRPRFPNAIQDWSAKPRMLKERSMIALMGELSDKPEWSRKILDEEIVKKWRNEAMEMAKNQAEERKVTEKMFDFVSTVLFGKLLMSSKRCSAD